MAFGKSAGPPASHQQLNDLLELLQDAGHEDFRDARGPMGFNQRQAGGKFTRDEAQQLIDQLEAAVDEANAAPARKPAEVELSETEQALREVSSEDLTAELVRRGFKVSEG